MGLDNNFTLKDNNSKIDIGYFHNFYELNDFIRLNCEETEKGSCIYKITKKVLEELRDELEPIYKSLIKLDRKNIASYDLYEAYPKRAKLERDEIENNNFNPLYSKSFYCGNKVLRLYPLVETLINNYKDDFIEFVSSF